MRIEDLNWMDVEEYLKHDDRLILVVGACEQHGYLSLLSDVKIPLALADAASQQTGVLLAPPVNFGSSPYSGLPRHVQPAPIHPDGCDRRHPAFGLRAGFQAHARPERARRQQRSQNAPGGAGQPAPGLKIQWYAWWMSHSVEEVALRHELKPSHANWLEAFPFTMVTDLPEADKIPPHVPSEILDAQTARQVYGDGSFGGPYRAAPEIMQEMFAACLADILQMLKFE